VNCPKCGHEAERVFETSGIVFKGSGFYNTDQKGK
jgi:predicted nucleic acid-binding Zn ribbon protein